MCFCLLRSVAGAWGLGTEWGCGRALAPSCLVCPGPAGQMLSPAPCPAAAPALIALATLSVLETLGCQFGVHVPRREASRLPCCVFVSKGPDTPPGTRALKPAGLMTVRMGSAAASRGSWHSLTALLSPPPPPQSQTPGKLCGCPPPPDCLFSVVHTAPLLQLSSHID